MAVKQLSAEVARKIAAGEVIDRPCAIVRELMDNAVDSKPTRIDVEIESGGIEKIRVRDDGCGMSKEDLEACARPHATSKISTEIDLLNLTTLGFRGEALASMAAVSRLQISSGQWRMNASITEDHILTAISPVQGTIVQTQSLFENFPARRVFLKRPASEGTMCRSVFTEKAIPCPNIAFSLVMDGIEKLTLPAKQTLKDRFVQCLDLMENAKLFYEIKAASKDGKSWSFKLIIGEPSVVRNNRKDIYIYINGRKIQEYSLVQAIEYGCTGYFPNGTHPVACLFVTMDPSLVDFNIHPAKKEARFKDITELHHSVSMSTKDFFRQYTIKTMILPQDEENEVSSPYLIEKYLSPKHSNAPNYNSISRSYSGQSEQEHRPFGQIEGRASLFANKPAAEMKDFNQGMSHIIGELAKESLFDEEKVSKTNYIESPDVTDDDGFHFVGLTLGTFLIAEKNDTLYIIDQHAAHERYLYNKIMADSGQKQTLLIPYVVETESQADDNYIEAIREKLDQAGFTGKKIRDGRWEFTSVPIRWKGTEKDLAKELLDRRVSPSDIINAAAASAACRAAVMDGTQLDESTAKWIAKEALALPDPHCPHGRPVYTTITRKQLFSLVRRI